MQTEIKTDMNFELSKRDDKRWYVPLNRNNLLNVLAGGVISPHKSNVNYENDLQRFAGDGVLLIRKGISSAMVDSDYFTGTSGYTVLAEITVDDLPKMRIRGISAEGNACETEISEEKYMPRVLSFPGAIPVTRITAIYFRCDSDKKNFIARKFENVPTDIVPLEVCAQLFEQDMAESIVEGLKNLSDDSNETFLKACYAKSDSYAGCAVLLVNTIPPKKNWMNLLKSVLTSKNYCSAPDIKAAEIISNKVEQNLFESAFAMMTEMDLVEGWQPKKVLSDLYSAIDKSTLSSEELSQLDKWLETCRDILNNKRSITPLTDSKMKVGRAILLLLLRPDPTDIINSLHSSLRPGMEVLSLAAILSGARYGLEALPNDLKSVVPGFGLYANLKSDLINSVWEQSVLHKYSSAPVITTAISEWKIVGQCYKVLADGKELIEKKDEGLPEFRAALAHAESLGIELKYERENDRLIYRHELHDDQTQTVYISVGKPSGTGDNVIRFWTPFLDISTTKGKKILNKAMYGKLLEKNCELNLYCRIGLSSSEKAVLVISDQIMATLDQSQFVSGLEHVAITANNLAMELGV